MLEKLQDSVESLRTSNFALHAMDTAVRQQKVSQRAAEEARERQEQEAAARQREAEARQQAQEEKLAQTGSNTHAIDLVVPSPSDSGASADDQSGQRGFALNVEA